MKKHILTLTAGFLCAMLLSPTASAVNRVPEIEIEVALRPDGSAYITQVWSADTNEGTEFYLERLDSGYLTITDFSVSDKNGPYTFVEDWDVNASFEEKANKCGILDTEKGVELCWGISEYGENRYAIEYVLHDLVGSYLYSDGFHHCFVDEMSFFPSDVVLTIRNQDGTPLTDKFCDIWAFGYDGQIQFENGVIRAWSESPLESGDYMTIMLSLDKGHLSPLRTVNENFDRVKELAFEGSNYDNSDEISPITTIFCSILLIFLWLQIAFLPENIKKISMKMRMKRVNYFRDIPNGGNLNVTYQLGLCNCLCEEDTLLGAYLLRLISQGCLESTENYSDHETVNLHLCHAPQSGNEYDNALYKLLENAAGADGILQPKELEKFCEADHTPIIRFMDACEQDGIRTLARSRCLNGEKLKNFKSLTAKGKQELDEILGLKRFLLDFSLIQERGVKDTTLWQDYMVYALMLGIADKLISQIRELYPQAIPQLEQYQRYTNHARHYMRVMHNVHWNQRRKGSGGKASRRGGRRSSGGGRGGSR